MAAIVETFLSCDGCSKNYGVDNRHRTAEMQRFYATTGNGWRVIGNKDYCPDCAPKFSTPQTTKI